MGANKKEFKNLLEQIAIPESLTLEQREPMLKTIVEYAHRIIPSKLFRYRECSETQFDAFYKDNIYASTADKFNDPYDCLLRFDKKFIFDSIHQSASKEHIKELRDYLKSGNDIPDQLRLLYGDERSQQLKEILLNASDQDLDNYETSFNLSKEVFDSNIESVLNNAVNYFKQQSHVACFSETIKSVTMWSHYTKSHTGFALEYDLRNATLKCDDCERKKDCPNRIVHNLYPVIYSGRRYDATNFVDCYLGRNFGLATMVDDILFFTKAALYKSPQWSYEKEWRLFLDKKDSYGLPCLIAQIKPIAIYYGNNISSINKKILSDMAREKGLKEYQMYIDPQSEIYSMKFRKSK